MQTSPSGLKLIQDFESILDGDKSTPDYEPYIDAVGVYTVGWGHALMEPGGELISVHNFGAAKAAELAHAAMMSEFGKYAITRDECSALFDKDVAKFEAGVEADVSADTTQSQFDALVSFAYNIGMRNFRSSSVMRLHNANQREVGEVSLPDLCAKAKAKVSPSTIAIAFAEWCHGGGRFLLGLFRRRMAELFLYNGMDEALAYQTAEAFHD